VIQIARAEAVTAIAVSAEGTSLLVGTAGGSVQRLSSGLIPGGELGRYGKPVTALFHLPKGDAVIGSPTGYVRGAKGVWVATPTQVGWIVPSSDGFVLSNGPGWVACSGGQPSLANIATGDVGQVRAGVSTRDGKTLFTAGDDGVIRSWELLADLHNRASTPIQVATAIAIHPDGHWFAVGSGADVTLRFGRKDERRGPTRGRGFAALRILKDGPAHGTLVAVEFRHREAIVCELTGKVVIEKVTFALPDGAHPMCAEFSEEGDRLAVGDDRGRVHVWEVRERVLVTTVELGLRQAVTQLSLAADGRFVAAPTVGGIGVWAIGEAKPMSTVPADDLAVYRLLPKGDRLVTSGRSGVVRVWNTASGTEEWTFHGPVGRVTAVAGSPDGRTLAAGGASGEVWIWDLRSGLELLETRRHTGPVEVICFAANNSLMVTCGGQFAVWDAREE
jgi:WD40 repeat protein